MIHNLLCYLGFVAYCFAQTPQVDVVPYQNGTRGELRLWEDRTNGTNYAGFRSSSALAGNTIWNLPTADSSGCWKSDGTLNLSIGACGLTLNSQTGATQTLVTGTSGTDFNISSASNVHTFNLPDASGSARGVVSTSTQTFQGQKTFNSNIVAAADIIPQGAGSNNVGTVTFPFSTANFASFYSRLNGGTCNYAGMTGNSVTGGTVFVQNSSCTTVPQLTANGFQIGANVVIDGSRNATLGNINSLGSYSGTVGTLSQPFYQMAASQIYARGNGTVAGQFLGYTNGGVNTAIFGDSAGFGGQLQINNAAGTASSFTIFGGTSAGSGYLAVGNQASIQLGSGTSIQAFSGSSINISGGSFFNRTISSAPSCSGVADGWTAVDTAFLRLYICISGVAHYANIL